MYRGFVMDTVSGFSEPDHKSATQRPEMVRVSPALHSLHQNNHQYQPAPNLNESQDPAAPTRKSF